MKRLAALTLVSALASAGCESSHERSRATYKAWAAPSSAATSSAPTTRALPASLPPPHGAATIPHESTRPSAPQAGTGLPAPARVPTSPGELVAALPNDDTRDEATAPQPPPRPEEMLAPERAGSVRPSGAGHVCFSWRVGHRSSTQCYSSIESCNAERRAAPAAEELTRCQRRSRASCTQIGSDIGPERHCFGDAARCAMFRAELDPSVSSTPCSAE